MSDEELTTRDQLSRMDVLEMASNVIRGLNLSQEDVGAWINSLKHGHENSFYALLLALVPSLLHLTLLSKWDSNPMVDIFARWASDMSRVMPTIPGFASLHSLQVLANYSCAAIAHLPNLRILDVGENNLREEQREVVDLSSVAELRLRTTIFTPLDDTSEFRQIETADSS